MNIVNGKGLTDDEISENIGFLPAIQGGENNIGILGYIDENYCKNNNYTIIKEPCLTVARVGTAGYVSYHEECVIGDKAKALIFKDKEIATPFKYMFICTILNENKYKYSYGRGLVTEIYMNESLKLPAQQNLDGTPVIDKDRTYSDEGYVPDWQFMEDYIKSLHHKPITTKVKTDNVKELDVDNWEEFKVQDLFKLVHGKANDGMLEEGNDCVYLGAKLNDCGFMRRCKYNEKLAHEGNCICFVTNGEGSVGYAFYKGLEDKFIATIDLVMGYADFLTPAIGSFIATCLCLERRKYSHGRKWKKTLSTTVIKLPIQRDSNGNPVIDDNRIYSDKGYIPDWQFMEDYINSLPYSDRI